MVSSHGESMTPASRRWNAALKPVPSPAPRRARVASSDVERARADRARRHALAVDRVEAAERVADHREPVRQRRELLVVAAEVGGKLVQRDRRQRLGVADRVVEIGDGEARGRTRGSPRSSSRRMVAEPADERHHPAVVLDRHEDAEPRAGRPRIDEERRASRRARPARGDRTGSRSRRRPAPRSRAAPATPTASSQRGCASRARSRRRRDRPPARSRPPRPPSRGGRRERARRVEHAGRSTLGPVPAARRRQRRDAPAHLPFEEAPALRRAFDAAREARLPVAEVEPARVARHVDAEWRPRARARRQMPGKSRRGCARPASAARGRGAPAARPSAHPAPSGKAVALDEQRPRRSGRARTAGRDQARQASADDDRAAA